MTKLKTFPKLMSMWSVGVRGKGTYARVAPRSGLAVKKMQLSRIQSVNKADPMMSQKSARNPTRSQQIPTIQFESLRLHTGAGVVDYDYRGEARSLPKGDEAMEQVAYFPNLCTCRLV